ncbi:MAG: hypothetical protein PHU64_03735 [Candidatus Omnitrophica bacterium]|nr:hypothetical protein [Candidatus Omnitrophota bacterium]MDD5429638.1 hypothetical protein [Candidatus Omnitrophota bacterium]
MERCKICKVPLSGVLGKVAKVLFRVKPSDKEGSVCNKCLEKKSNKKTSKLSQSGTYQCQICGRMIHKEHSLEHVKAEEYIINLIRKDHVDWRHKEPTCQECLEYYRKLVKENEI